MTYIIHVTIETMAADEVDRFVGPFKTEEDARKYAEDHFVHAARILSISIAKLCPAQSRHASRGA